MSPTKALFLIALGALALARAASAANVDGANVHWTSTGSGSQAVIFVHGWTCDESSWSAQVPAFSAKYRVITLDLPGHGKSAAPANGMFSASTSPTLQDRILKMMLGAPQSTATGAMGAMFDPSWRSAEPVKVPVLGLFAENSQLDDGAAMKTVFPTAESHEVPGTGHFLMLEKPAEFNKLLSDFLAKIR